MNLKGAITKKLARLSETQSASLPKPLSPGLGWDKILVAVDFSDSSRQALELGVSLAKAVGAEIVLVHVFQGVVGELKVMEAVYSDEGFREDAQRGLEEWSQEVTALGIRSKTRFCDGSTVDEEILTVAAEEGVDLIVLGTHERGFLLKKTVNRVLNQARCPVLVADRPEALAQ